MGLICFLSVNSPGQSNTVSRPTSENRYLFILDTSRGMQRRSDGTVASVRALIGSDFCNQLRPGDTMGFWTFNEQLYSGQFALEQWTMENRKTIEEHVLSFVKRQKYEKSANFAWVRTNLVPLLKGSEFITVFLISDGLTKFEGTDFDEPINQGLAHWRDEQRKANQPIISVLRVRRGKMTSYSVTPAQWPVDLPPLPELPPVVTTPKKTNQAPVVVTAKPTPPVSTVPPLIIIGKKNEPTNTQNSLIVSPDELKENAANAPSSVSVNPSTESLNVGKITTNQGAPAELAMASTNPAKVQSTNALVRSGGVKPESSGATVVAQASTPQGVSGNTSPATNVQAPTARVPESSNTPELSGAAPAGIGGFALRNLVIIFIVAGIGSAIVMLVLKSRPKNVIRQSSLITRSLEKETVLK